MKVRPWKAPPKAMIGGAAGGDAGDLDRVLDRLGAGRDEDRALLEVAGHEGVQPLAEADVVLVGQDLVAGVGEAVELAAGRRR